jgi:hypothetical protein
MKIVEPGHVYELHSLDGDGTPVTITFVNREPGTEHPGTQTQEVLRSLIDRTMHCDNCLRWAGNDKIIHHLRMALALHESRALERKAEKGYYDPEQVVTNGRDGHFAITEYNPVMPDERGADGKFVVTDAQVYHMKDKTFDAESKAAQYHGVRFPKT